MLETDKELKARATQQQVDSDVADFKRLSSKMDMSGKRDALIEESKQRIQTIFELVSKLMPPKKRDLTQKFTYQGKEKILRVTEYQDSEVSGSVEQQGVRIIVNDVASRQTEHEVMLKKYKNSSQFILSYLDYNYSGSGAPYKWRKPNKESTHFDAEDALDNIPELKDIEKMLQKIVSEQEKQT